MNTIRDPLQAIWLDDLSGVLVPTADQVRLASARHFARQRRRNYFEYAAAGLTIVVFAIAGLSSDMPAMQLGAGLIALASLFVATSLHFLSRGVAPHMDTASRNYYAASLIREHNMLRTIWLWYVLPFVPGYLLCRYAAYSEIRPGELGLQLLFDVAAAAGAAVVVLWNRRRADALRAEVAYVLES
jgi:hypothetical protein